MRGTIWFVIVAYNSDKKVLRAFRHALAGQQVIVVDNTKKNFGYGGAANKGIRKALKEGAEWAVVMNQDLTISRKGIETLIKALESSPRGIVGPFAGMLDHRRWTTILQENQNELHKATPCPSTSLRVNSQGSGLGEQEYISGSLMAIHRDVIEKIGYFYEPYFMYYEDVDYCIRAKRAGFPLIHTYNSDIRHHEHPSLGKGSFLHEYYLARNHLLFIERQAPVLVKLYEVLRLPKTIAQAIDNKGKRTGLMDYFLRRFGEKK